MGKLTLSVDERVVARAKKYAQDRGLSISSIVEAYLDVVSSARLPAGRDAPILRSVRGSLKKADIEGRKGYLAAKYR